MANIIKRRMSKIKNPSRRVPFDNSLCVSEMMEIDKRELVEELIWLRENSKDALQKSWKEVECLRRKCVDHTEAEAKLTAALKDSQTQEEVWRLRFLAAEKGEAIPSVRETFHNNYISSSRPLPIKGAEERNDICSVDNNMQLSQEKKVLSKFRSMIWPWASGNEMEEDANNRVSKNIPRCSEDMTLPSTTQSTTKVYASDRDKELCLLPYDTTQQVLYPDQNTSIPSSALPHESTQKGVDGGILNLSLQKMPEERLVEETIVRVKSREDLSLILSSRDKIIVSLEQALHQQLKDTQNMQAEMKCLMITQKKREKRLSIAYRKKEERLQRLLKSRMRCENCATPFVERLRSLLFENSELKPYNKEEKCEKEEKEYCSSNEASLDESLCTTDYTNLCGASIPRQDYGTYTVERHTPEELSLTLSSRDNIIESLEQTVAQQLMKMQNMQAEMV